MSDAVGDEPEGRRAAVTHEPAAQADSRRLHSRGEAQHTHVLPDVLAVEELVEGQAGLGGGGRLCLQLCSRRTNSLTFPSWINTSLLATEVRCPPRFHRPFCVSTSAQSSATAASLPAPPKPSIKSLAGLLSGPGVVQKCGCEAERTFEGVAADTPVNLSSSLASLLELRLSLKELASADLSDRRSQRGDSGKTPGTLQGGGTKHSSTR